MEMTRDEVEYHAHTPTGPRSGERPLLKLWNRRPGSGARAFCRHWHAERTICTPPVWLSPPVITGTELASGAPTIELQS